MQPVVHVAPESDRAIEEAITAAGGRIGPLDEADALVWLDWDSNTFDVDLPERVRWVQLPAAGVERWLERTRDGPWRRSFTTWRRERGWRSPLGARGI